MPDDLGARLLRAGLVTREQLAQALSRTPRPGGALAEALVSSALDPDELLAFFVASGYGPPVPTTELATPASEALTRLPAAMAHALLVLPLAVTADSIDVAMADPSDAHAQAEVRRVTGRTVTPRVARVLELRRALDRHYPPIGRTSGVVPVPSPSRTEPSFDLDDDEPIVLVRRRPSTPAEPDEAPLPLVRPKTLPPLREPPEVAPPEIEDRWDSPPRSADVGLGTSVSWPIPRGNRTPLPTSSSMPPGDLGAILANLRVRNDRDALVQLTCEGALTVGRSAFFLALRKGVFRGWAGAGSDTTPEAVRNLWIPLRSPSMLREVAERPSTYLGPYGDTAADALLRAAIEARGRLVCLSSVVVQTHTAGVLVVDDPRYGDAGRERIEILAHALGEAFKRVLTTIKPAL